MTILFLFIIAAFVICPIGVISSIVPSLKDGWNTHSSKIKTGFLIGMGGVVALFALGTGFNIASLFIGVFCGIPVGIVGAIVGYIISKETGTK